MRTVRQLTNRVWGLALLGPVPVRLVTVPLLGALIVFGLWPAWAIFHVAVVLPAEWLGHGIARRHKVHHYEDKAARDLGRGHVRNAVADERVAHAAAHGR